MIASVEPLNSGFAIDDLDDPRSKYYSGLRERFGTFLHNASTSLRQQGEENTVDAVAILVWTMRFISCHSFLTGLTPTGPVH